jgi:hydrogenase maturation protease
LTTLVIGLGNEILGDEGVGVHAARALAAMPLPDGTEVLEVGTAILDALPALETPDRILIIDAMTAQGPPGSVYHTRLEDCTAAPCIASMHGFDIFRVMALAGRAELPDIVVFGVEPASIAWSTELTPAVRSALPHLLEAVLKELETVDH